MEKAGPWVPVWIAMGLFLTGGILFIFVPETLGRKDLDAPQDSSSSSSSLEVPSLRSRLSHILSQFRESLSILNSASLILLLLTALASSPVVDATSQFLNQFVSKRYHIKIAQTGYVQTMYGVVGIIQSLFILPLLSRRLVAPTTPTRFRAKDEQHRDLSIARWSYMILSLGSFTLGVSPSLAGFLFGLVLMAVGSGYSSLARSLMSVYVDPEHRSRLFTIVGMVEVLGNVYSQPMLAGLFALGLRLNGAWIGLPYFGLAVLVGLSASLLLFVRIPGRKSGDAVAASEGEEDA